MSLLFRQAAIARGGQWISAMRRLGVAVLVTAAALTPGKPTRGNVNDFIAYWTAAHEVIGGHDPYAAGPVLALERQLGFAQAKPLIMRNPPWAVPVIVLLGLLPFGAAQGLWLVGNLIAVMAATRWLWGVYQAKGEQRWTPWLATAVFLPVAVGLAIGQMSPLVLLGIAGFLHFEKKEKLGRAGAFLYLVALKPHLVFLLWIGLLFWTIRKSKGRILAALGVVTLSASLIAIAMDHAIFAQYFGLLTSGGVLAELSPTLGGVFRLWFPQHQWVQALPAVLALLWFLFRWRKVRDGWQWREEMPILLLASLLTTSYGWFFDQIVLLPCVFQAAEWLTTSRRSISAGVAILYVCMNAMVLALILEHRTTFWYAWTVPAWCGLYGFCRVLGRDSSTTTASTAVATLAD
ncbi:MAG: glycosyltransferase family 87 protein [Terriglobales bacterium]